MKELWVNKYSPKTLNEYVFKDLRQKEQVESWVKTGAVPHLLFTGAPGTGKTTLAKILLNELKVDPADILVINASVDNGVEFIRDTILNFSTTVPFGEFKYILLDECDYLSHNAQAALRGVMVDYSSITRFILTANYSHKIIQALHSRCQGFHIDKLDKSDFEARLAEILVAENVEVDIDTLNNYVDATYPDLRKCINLCQMNSQTGVLKMPTKQETGQSDYKLEMVSLFKAKKYKEARDIICKQASAEEYDEIYRFLYDNLDFWGDTEDQQNEAIIIIRRGLVNDLACADREINLSATITELAMINRS